MWSLVNPFGIGQMGPNAAVAAQKRNFGFLHLANINIAPGKCFTNPNFVNKNHNHIHKDYSDYCHPNQPDIKLNSSQDTLETPSSNTENTAKTSRKRNRKNRKKRRKKDKEKKNRNHCKQNLNKKDIEDMMETNQESTDTLNTPDNTPHPQSLCLNDFLTDKLSKEPPPSDFCTFFSVAPINKFFCRQRQVSIAESEDSFIVFDSGTDEELESTEIDSDSSSTDIEEEDDLDLSFNTLPSKKVRFAKDLCEVHPMIKWSFAYQRARMGPWEKYARDRDRFNKRIRETEKIISPIFNSKHREKVFNERFQ